MIVVTGASKGLGLSIAKRLKENNYKVFGVARSMSPCQDIFDDIMQCDVADYSDVKALAQSLKRSEQSIEAVINAAGVASMNLAVTTPVQVSQKLINTNLLGTIYCSQLISPLMMRRKQGAIINFSTIAVALGLKGESIYAASKAGVEGFSRAFAREMADFNVRVNCIAPGPIETDLIKGVSDEKIQKIVEQQIIPRQFEPDNVCDLVELLLDERSSSLSGQVFHIGGC